MISLPMTPPLRARANFVHEVWLAGAVDAIEHDVDSAQTFPTTIG